jgi:hypothetical protein
VILAAPDVLKLSTTSALSAILDFSLPTVLLALLNAQVEPMPKLALEDVYLVHLNADRAVVIVLVNHANLDIIFKTISVSLIVQMEPTLMESQLLAILVVKLVRLVSVLPPNNVLHVPLAIFYLKEPVFYLALLQLSPTWPPEYVKLVILLAKLVLVPLPIVLAVSIPHSSSIPHVYPHVLKELMLTRYRGLVRDATRIVFLVLEVLRISVVLAETISFYWESLVWEDVNRVSFRMWL